MSPLDLVQLQPLLERTAGRPEVTIGLIDGPVALRHPDLAGGCFREIPGGGRSLCAEAGSVACRHGTFVAGILAARRGASAPAICPGCTFLIRPIFTEATAAPEALPSASPHDLALAIGDCVTAGARVINLSLGLAQPAMTAQAALADALDLAMRRGVIVVAAAGNQGAVGSSALTRHHWVIPVAACDETGRPARDTNLALSIGKRGLRAPGAAVTSLGTEEGAPLVLSGTSAAAPFVTGTVALLWSAFPRATAAEVKRALAQPSGRRATVVPPLLDAAAAFQALAMTQGGRAVA